MIGLLVLLAPVVSAAQAAKPECSPVGTWYGGGDGTIKYIAVVTPLTGNRFQVIFHGATDATAIGFPVNTITPGEFRKEKQGEWDYVGTAMMLMGTSTSMPPASNPDIWVVRYRVRLEACDTLKVQHDLFGGYHWDSPSKPLIDLPDYLIAPTPIDETYTRLPIDCPACTVP
jgi:hypothetical protein